MENKNTGRDLKQWHFDKGEQFDETIFNDLIHGLNTQMKMLPKAGLIAIIVWGFIFAVSQLCSSFIGGVIGHTMALILIFTSILSFPISMNIALGKANKIIRFSMTKLGINNNDIAVARKHLKNGTYAWQPKN